MANENATESADMHVVIVNDLIEKALNQAMSEYKKAEGQTDEYLTLLEIRNLMVLFITITMTR